MQEGGQWWDEPVHNMRRIEADITLPWTQPTDDGDDAVVGHLLASIRICHCSWAAEALDEPSIWPFTPIGRPNWPSLLEACPKQLALLSLFHLRRNGSIEARRSIPAINLSLAAHVSMENYCVSESTGVQRIYSGIFYSPLLSQIYHLHTRSLMASN